MGALVSARSLGLQTTLKRHPPSCFRCPEPAARTHTRAPERGPAKAVAQTEPARWPVEALLQAAAITCRTGFGTNAGLNVPTLHGGGAVRRGDTPVLERPT